MLLQVCLNLQQRFINLQQLSRSEEILVQLPTPWASPEQKPLIRTCCNREKVKGQDIKEDEWSSNLVFDGGL
jgi:hypothetical protein